MFHNNVYSKAFNFVVSAVRADDLDQSVESGVENSVEYTADSDRPTTRIHIHDRLEVVVSNETQSTSSKESSQWESDSCSNSEENVTLWREILAMQ